MWQLIFEIPNASCNFWRLPPEGPHQALVMKSRRAHFDGHSKRSRAGIALSRRYASGSNSLWPLPFPTLVSTLLRSTASSRNHNERTMCKSKITPPMAPKDN